MFRFEYDPQADACYIRVLPESDNFSHCSMIHHNDEIIVTDIDWKGGLIGLEIPFLSSLTDSMVQEIRSEYGPAIADEIQSFIDALRVAQGNIELLYSQRPVRDLKLVNRVEL